MCNTFIYWSNMVIWHISSFWKSACNFFNLNCQLFLAIDSLLKLFLATNSLLKKCDPSLKANILQRIFVYSFTSLLSYSECLRLDLTRFILNNVLYSISVVFYYQDFRLNLIFSKFIWICYKWGSIQTEWRNVSCHNSPSNILLWNS